MSAKWDPTGAYDWGKWAPPWFNAERGAWEGPTSMGGYERQLSRFNMSVEGGGFYDFSRDPLSPGATAKGRGNGVQRAAFDHDLLREYVDAEGATGCQQDAYLLVVEQRMSIGQAAKKLGIDRTDVRIHLHRLQRKAEAWRRVQEYRAAG